jgi:hypothetical protein
MNLTSPFRIGVISISLLILGEAIALLLGMHLLSGRGNPWISFKNDLLLGLDIAAGAGLLYLAAVNHGTSQSNFGLMVLLLGLFTHGYRVWEYLTNVTNKFCLNPPLFVVNNLKLGGLFLVFGAGIVLRIMTP